MSKVKSGKNRVGGGERVVRVGNGGSGGGDDEVQVVRVVGVGSGGSGGSAWSKVREKNNRVAY